jgi:hypothetical protein
VLSLSLIVTSLIAIVLIVVAFRRPKGSPSKSSAQVFAMLSPLPVLLTIGIPMLINLLTSFHGGRAVNAFTVAGCALSAVFVVVGVGLFVQAMMNSSKDTRLLIPSTLLASIPAAIYVFIILFGFGGVMRR